MIALISKWGRAALSLDDATCSRRAYLYPAAEETSCVEALLRASEGEISYNIIQGKGSPFVEDGKIFITLEILESILGKSIERNEAHIQNALVELNLDDYKRAQFLGILYHENFHKEGIMDEVEVDRQTVSRLHAEMGEEAALAYIDFLETHGPGFLRNCWLMLSGKSQHLDAASRGEELRGFLDSSRSFDRSLEAGLRQTNLRIYSDAFRSKDSRDENGRDRLRLRLPPVKIRK